MVAKTTLACLCGGLGQLYYHTGVQDAGKLGYFEDGSRGRGEATSWRVQREKLFSDAPMPVDGTGARVGVTDMPWLPYQSPKNPALGRQCWLMTGWDLAAQGGRLRRGNHVVDRSMASGTSVLLSGPLSC